jgi:branched-chain amino acid transport system permease protein
VRATKLIAFALSSAIAGLAGVLYCYNTGAVDPNEFALLAGLGAVAYAYLGGITTVTGAAIGGLLAPAGLASFAATRYIGLSVDSQLVLYGLAVVLAVMFTPEGAAAKLRSTFRATGNARPAAPSTGGAGGRPRITAIATGRALVLRRRER